MLGSFCAFSFLRVRSGYEALDVKLEWTIRQLSSALSAPLWNLDLDSARSLLERTLEDRDLRYIRVDSTDGLFPAIALGDDTGLSTPPRPGLARFGSVYYGEALLAGLAVRGTDERILREFVADMAGFALMLAALETALSLALYLLLWKAVLKPLLAVNAYALSVFSRGNGARKSETAVPGDPAVRNELVLLESSVRGMVSRLEDRMEEKAILIDELSHRVKNNLSIIYGLLDLQLHRFADPAVEGMIGAMQARIHALSALHQHLLRTEDLRRIPLKPYLEDVAAGIRGAAAVELRCEIEDVVLDIETAQSCGLVVTELLSNALRHAFPESSGGNVLLSVFREEEVLRILVADDGVGLPPEGVRDATGMQVLKGMMAGLRGRLTLRPGNPSGTEAMVEMTVFKKESMHEGSADSRR